MINHTKPKVWNTTVDCTAKPDVSRSVFGPKNSQKSSNIYLQLTMLNSQLENQTITKIAWFFSCNFLSSILWKTNISRVPYLGFLRACSRLTSLCMSSSSLGDFLFYPPQRSYGKVMFSQACVVWGGGMQGRVCAWWGACAWWGSCMAGWGGGWGACAAGETVHCSRRYASYWNAFLF